MNRYFIQWMVLFSLVMLGSYVALYNGLFYLIYDADFTKISFGIFALFLYQSMRIGYGLYKDKFTDKILSSSDYFIDVFVKLGFIGTLVGFIYSLYHAFGCLDVADASQTQTAMLFMAKGMGCALYTTVTGLICAASLKTELYIYETASPLK